MNNLNGHGKLNAIGAAIARLPVLSDIEREAMERIPLKDAMRDLAKQLQDELDAALQAAVEKFLGHPITEPETQVLGRLKHMSLETFKADGSRGDETGDTYYMDGAPVLWVGPARYEREGDTMKASRDMRQLINSGAAK